MSKYGHRPHDWFEAVINKLGGEDAAQEFLRGRLVITKPQCTWHDQANIIYFSVTSDGTTGKEWIKRLEKRDIYVEDAAESMLLSPAFKPTSGVTTRVVILRSTFFATNERTNGKIRSFAAERRLKAPNAEVACLIRDAFYDRQVNAMGFGQIAVMHKPINTYGEPHLFGVFSGDESNRRLLSSFPGHSEVAVGCESCGFAFEANYTVP